MLEACSAQRQCGVWALTALGVASLDAAAASTADGSAGDAGNGGHAKSVGVNAGVSVGLLIGLVDLVIAKASRGSAWPCGAQSIRPHQTQLHCQCKRWQVQHLIGTESDAAVACQLNVLSRACGTRRAGNPRAACRPAVSHSAGESCRPRIARAPCGTRAAGGACTPCIP